MKKKNLVLSKLRFQQIHINYTHWFEKLCEAPWSFWEKEPFREWKPYSHFY